MNANVRTQTDRRRNLRVNATDAENALWYALRNRQLAGHKFVRQFSVGPYIVDFVCRENALIIEVDGGQHDDCAKDEARTTFLNREGYAVLRFWNNEVLTNREGVLFAIHSVLQGHPSPDLRFAPATLSPKGRGIRGAKAAYSTISSPLRGEVDPKDQMRGEQLLTSTQPIGRTQ